ncbi:hypothetical protein AAC387_Pa11g0126 [Persea americana]
MASYFVIVISAFLLLLLSNNPLRCEAGNVLYVTGPMYPGQFLRNQDYVLMLQPDCNLVLYDKSQAFWATNTKASTCSLTLERTGELVLSNGSGNRMWGSNKKGGQGDYVLVLQKDRNLVVYGPPRWASKTQVAATSPPRIPTDMDMRAENVLYPGSILYPGNSLKNKNWELRLEPSCNLVLYENGDKVIWSTNTAGKANACYLKMELNGNLHLYAGGGNTLWAAGTGAGYSVLVLQSDRNLVIFGPGIWNTGTPKSGLGLPASLHHDTNTITTLPLFSS